MSVALPTELHKNIKCTADKNALRMSWFSSSLKCLCILWCEFTCIDLGVPQKWPTYIFLVYNIKYFITFLVCKQYSKID